MGKILLGYAGLLLVFGFLAGCGTTNDNSSAATGNVPVVVTMQDTPPAGVTVLDGSVTVTAITLNGQGIANDNLLTKNVTVQLGALQTQSTLIANTTAQQGTYTSVTITFSSPSLTVQNGSTAALTVNGTTCATAAICTVSPTLNQASVTISTTPFPLSLTASTPVNLALDFNLNSSIQSNLTITPTVTLTSPAVASSTSIQNLSVTGQVSQAGANQFTVTDPNTAAAMQISDNSSTTFNGFTTNSTNCTTANTAPCVANNQNVVVNYGISSVAPNALTATSVTLLTGITNGITGVVISRNTSANQFTMVTSNASPSQTGTAVGHQILVTVANGATFEVQPPGVTIPSGLAFTGIATITAGQTVEINATSFSATGGGTNTGTGTIGTATANVIALVPSQFSGNLASVSGSNLTVNGLSGVFTGGGTNSLTVNTASGTTFQGVTGTSGLTAGQPVTVGGEVFTSGGSTTVVGTQVRQTH